MPTVVIATQVRPASTGPAALLPLALIVILLGVALGLATVAPSRVTSGIYQVIVGDGPSRFTIPTESLTCNRNGDLARCTVPVAGKPLAITIQYAGYDSTCTARHGDRVVACASGLGDYGQASNTVWISDGLGVTEPERAGLRDAMPWWRTANGPSTAALVLIAALTAAAGLAAYLLSRRTRPEELALRMPAALGVAALGLILFAAGGLIMAPTQGFDHAWPMLIAPPALIAAAALGAWQYQLGGVSTRRARTIGAALATAAYTAAVGWGFLPRAGFID